VRGRNWLVAASSPARNTGVAVEAGIEGHDFLAAVLFHDADVHGVVGGQRAPAEDDPLAR
jgi:hypothetical protein